VRASVTECKLQHSAYLELLHDATTMLWGSLPIIALTLYFEVYNH
jgi:hypothetical protein